MDIKIEAPKHANQRKLIEFYSKALNKKYGNYPFVKAIDVKVVATDTKETKVTLQLKPEKGTMLFASAEDENENRAFQAVLGKMNIQIEKYKQKHYHKRGEMTRSSFDEI